MRRRQTGSVVLVALSCVTVLGIALASFLAVSNQAMKLSNRTYALAVSRQLAQNGLERALRAYNAGTFGPSTPSSVDDWTITGGTNPTSATKNYSISTDHYGSSGITASIKVRVDHYRDTVGGVKRGLPWNPFLTYAVNDFVWYQGVWYLCIVVPTAVSPATTPATYQPPSNTTYWKSAPETWTPYANYRIGNIVLSGGGAYRCTAENINQVPPNASYWTSVTASVWSLNAVYTVDNLVYSGSMVYRCIAAHTGHGPPNTTYWLSAPVIYAEGVAVLPDSSSTTFKTQLRATLAPAPLFPNAAGSQNLTNLSSTGYVDSYNSVIGAPSTSVAASYKQTTTPYSTAAPNVGSSAVVAGAKTSGTAVAITNVRVNGYLAAPSASTAPYTPSYTNSNAAMVTSTADPGVPPVKVELTRISRSPYIPQFDIQSVSPGTINYLPVSDYDTTLPRSGDNINTADGKYYYYTSTDLYINNNDVLTINGPVVIDVRPSNSAGFRTDSSGKIVIKNNVNYPASLEVHFGGILFIGNNGGAGIDNQTLDPKRCIILGTNTYNSSSYHYYWSSLPFYGVIYMPNAYLHLWNSGYNLPIYGALSASNIYFNHTTNLHYDTSLRTAVISGVDAPYEIAEWRELTDLTERVTLP